MENTDIELRFGKEVRELRLKLGLTQDELAAQAGLHRTYISDIERGRRNVSLQSIERIAQALNVSISCLFGATVPLPMEPVALAQDASLSPDPRPRL